MKYLNNIVVELDDPKNGKELIDTLMSFGAKNPLYYEGTAKGNCYEVIDKEIALVRKPTNKKIITLEQLKDMKTNQDYKNSDEYLRAHLGDNMNFGTLTPYAISELMENYHKNQLKAMKEDKGEYPKLMYVGDDWNNLKMEDRQRVVFLKTRKGYWCYDNEYENSATLFEYAQDIEPEAPIKKEVIDIAMNKDIFDYAIVKINGKEIQYKK